VCYILVVCVTYWSCVRQFLLQTRPNDGSQLTVDGLRWSNCAPTRALGNFDFFCWATVQTTYRHYITQLALPNHYYWQHCMQRKAMVFKLLRGRFWSFSPHRGDKLHRWGWHLEKVPSSLPNFTLICATIRV